MLSFYIDSHETSDSPGVEDVSYWFWGQKGQGQNVLITEMVIGTQFLSLYTYNRETSHTDSPWVEDMPVWLRGKNLESFDWLS